MELVGQCILYIYARHFLSNLHILGTLAYTQTYIYIPSSRAEKGGGEEL
jgi:hypothetical protein